MAQAVLRVYDSVATIDGDYGVTFRIRPSPKANNIFQMFRNQGTLRILHEDDGCYGPYRMAWKDTREGTKKQHNMGGWEYPRNDKQSERLWWSLDMNMIHMATWNAMERITSFTIRIDCREEDVD